MIGRTRKGMKMSQHSKCRTRGIIYCVKNKGRLTKILLVFLILFAACNPPALKRSATGLIHHVDPLIGAVAKSKYYGRTFPGSTLPYSLVKLGPDTYTGGDVGSGYSFEHHTLEGFSFVHMSGIGWFGDFGNLLVTPTNGEFHPNRGSVENPGSGYRSRISHDTEIASPGYYTIDLKDYNIKAEMTSTMRTGILRFSFPGEETNRIQIDLARRIGGTSLRQYIKVIDNKRIEGWMEYSPDGGGWGNGKTNMVFYTFYFSAEFSRPFANHGIWSAEIPEGQTRKAEDIVSDSYQNLIKNSKIFEKANEVEGDHIGFYAEYPDLKEGEQVMLKAGISFVDLEGARKNLASELNHWDFEKVKADAESAWEKQIQIIKIEGATEEQKKIFYTSMYHAQMDPRGFTDVDGRFYLRESGVNQPGDFNYRTIFSGWDAFRSHMPLLTIIDPGLVNEVVNSLIAKAEDGGMGFPKWEIAGCYSNCMLGDPALPVILDAWTKGIRGYDLKEAYEIGKQTSLGPNTIRNGWQNFNEKGYVDCNPVPERWNGYYKGVSATLENCYADWCIGQMAKELGDVDGEKQFLERAQYYRNIFDPDVGFFRGKYKNGEWIPWEGELTFRQGNIESNPLQQLWFVPHDIDGLKSLIGEERFLSELENMFERTPPDFPFNEYYNHANEPVHHVPYLFNQTKKPWLTQKWVRKILENAYGTGPYGIMGNDDVGQMSAWYILSSLGFHPVCQGDNRYWLGSPQFSKAVIQLDKEYHKGETFTIFARNNSKENIYIQKVTLNGKKLNRPYILHDEITNGGELVFEMGNFPNKNLFKKPGNSDKVVSKPNILIIQPDQHRGDYLGCAGHSTVKTPNLDKLAAEGIRFTHAASASPVCCPFRATMQTGLYIHEHGVVDNGIQLNYKFKGIAELFAENGYATGYIGKWHLGGFLPEELPGGYIEEGEARFGWQEWYGYEKSHEFLKVWKYNDQKEKVPVEGYEWEPTWHTDMALDFIKRKAEEGVPWCYYIAYGPPHKPEQCIQEFLDMYPPGKFVLTPDAQKLPIEKQNELREILQMYHAQVTAIDHEIGRIEKGLKEMGVDENTIIIYTSDHGDVLGSHNEEIVQKYIKDGRNINNTLRTKGKPFSMAFRIPFIIKGAGIQNPGTVTDALLSSVDITPTILGLADIEVPEYMQGINLSDWYRKGDGQRQDHIYLGLRDEKNAWRAVWDGEYFLSELAYQNMYNTEKDPMELSNLYSDPEYIQKKNMLQKELIKLAKKTGDPILPKLEEAIK